MKRNSLNAVRAARESAGLTQITLCLRAKIGLTTLRSAEQGYASKGTLSAIAKVLGADLDVLTGRREAA